VTRAKEGRGHGRWLAAVAALLLFALALPASAGAATFTVNSTADQADANAGNGVCASASGACTLRAAIQEANAPPASADNITVPAGTYHLTLGELPVTQPVVIDGAGAGATIIDAGLASRVLHFSIPVGAAALTATVQDVTISGGQPPASTTVGGGGIRNDTGGTLIVRNSVITGNRAAATDNSNGHGGAGISNVSTGGLQVFNSTVSNNQLAYPFGGFASGGAGIQSTAGAVQITGSTISGNSVLEAGSGDENGGGGLRITGAAQFAVTNTTISGNVVGVPNGLNNGGGGVFTDGSNGNIRELGNVTIAGNQTNGVGAGLLASNDASPLVTLARSIVAGNTGAAQCAVAGSITLGSGGANMATDNSCAPIAADFPNTDPQVGPLAANGGPTMTQALPPGSPAIDKVDLRTCATASPTDQRGLSRPRGTACDIGAYEFDGLSSITPPSCVPTPTLALGMAPPSGESVGLARFRVDGGGESTAPAGAVPVPDGSHTLEFWGTFGGVQELAHHSASVLVDTTPPLVEIVSNQGKFGYTVGETASFHVTASDATSGLATDPTAGDTKVDTSKVKEIPVSRTGVDNCGNTTTASETFKILPKPDYGKTVNLVPVSGDVFVSLARRQRRGKAGAHASQKGTSFIPLREARQVPVGTLVDTRKGTVELVSARNLAASRLQSGKFAAGIFQTLQSRKRRARGLTELRLKGSSFRRCHAGRGKGASAAALSKRTIRRLRANAKGRFRTRGRHSAATVRGTIWITADRCDGTLTTVRRGTVAVRDFRRKKTILVHAGKRYLARARG
jgi:CSLREA domain-containing protein